MRCKEVFEILKRSGWRSLGFQKGHLIMEKDGKTTSIPWHSGQEIAKSTLQSIKKQTGVRFK